MTATTDIQDVLSNARSDGGKLILLYLSRAQTATSREIAQKLDITLSKTHSVLQHLEDNGLIQRKSNTERTTYTLATDAV